MLLALAILVVLLLLNGVFAMAELAVMTSQKSRLQQSASSGHRGAAKALELAREPTRFLSTVQVGVTLIGILSGALAERILAARLEEKLLKLNLSVASSEVIALVSVVVLVTYLSVVLGELVPKRLAMAFPEQMASLISRPLSWLSKAASWPVRTLTASTELVLKLMRVNVPQGDDVSEEDVRAVMERAARTGVFSQPEYQLFRRVFRVGDLAARDLMVPRQRVVWIEAEEPTTSTKNMLAKTSHSYFPVCVGGLDEVVGVLHLQEFLARSMAAEPTPPIRDMTRKPVYVPEGTPALRVLERLREEREHIGFVVSEHGAVLGVITASDVVTAIVGGLPRQGETRAPKTLRRNDGSWLIDGSLPVHDLYALLGVPEAPEAPRVATVGGLLHALFGKVPSEGDHIAWNGWIFEVIDMDGTRVDKVLALREEPTEPSA